MKRAFDIVSSAVALAALSPVLIAISTILRLKHGKPVIFRQSRLGLEGETFQIHKFRTMEQHDGSLVTSGRDSRVHATGKWLRATKLDELPQLWDVLRGQMSIVGPRPEVPRLAAHWPEADRRVILSVRPGLTDPASIVFRHEESILAMHSDPEVAYLQTVLPVKCQLYVDYVNDQTLGKDFWILWRTAKALLRRADS